jgi:hypothetical protein
VFLVSKAGGLVGDNPLKREEVMMTAPSAALQSTKPSRVPPMKPRASSRLICTICADTMVAAEASALLADGAISYLWACETCGHSFVTKHGHTSDLAA